MPKMFLAILITFIVLGSAGAAIGALIPYPFISFPLSFIVGFLGGAPLFELVSKTLSIPK